MKTRLLLAFTLLLLLLGCAETNRMDNVKFNQEEWSIGDYRTRGNMVENMIEDSILIGKSKMEVLELLGDQGGTSGNFSYPVDLGLQTH
jgi:outer membrane protein assembly factor BamE (lipoprotein component of BamABCDE complex)